jgi:hypothetical protein
MEAIAGTSGEYVSVSNLRMEIAGGAARVMQHLLIFNILLVLGV